MWADGFGALLHGFILVFGLCCCMYFIVVLFVGDCIIPCKLLGNMKTVVVNRSKTYYTHRKRKF